MTLAWERLEPPEGTKKVLEEDVWRTGNSERGGTTFHQSAPGQAGLWLDLLEVVCRAIQGFLVYWSLSW